MQNSILDKLAAVPGVSSVGFAASVPMSGAEPNWDEIMIEGKNYQGESLPMRLYNYVSPGYFRTAAHGIRMALGANKNGLVWMFVRSALVLTIVGTAVAWGGRSRTSCALCDRCCLGSGPLDPVTFIVVPVVLVVAAALASYLPARRTTAVNPVEALRAE